MKKMILSALVLISASSAMAATQTMSCVVPAQKTQVTMNIELSKETSVDYVTMTLVEPNATSVFFSQLDPGSIDEQIGNGYLQLLAMTDKTGQTSGGVIVNTGFLALGKEANGTFGGFLSAKGNIYPLSCKM